MPHVQYLNRPNINSTDINPSDINPSDINPSGNYRLAYRYSPHDGPLIIWCGGLKSDMEGSKAVYLHQWAQDNNQNFIRFDYYGHGLSDGDFTDGTLTQWANDITDIITAFGNDMAGQPHKIILIGSSMGGWAALLTAVAQPARISGLLLINPAPDFTEKLTRPSWSAAQIKALEHDGIVYEPSGYEEPYAYSRALMDDGKKRQILDAPIRLSCPVEILSGQKDKVVPTAYAARLLEVIEIETSDIDNNGSNATSQHVNFTKVMGADHSLSRPQDLKLITARLENLLKPIF